MAAGRPESAVRLAGANGGFGANFAVKRLLME
jgi:hypothetical protein